MNTIDIFISHSNADEKVARALIDLLRDAFDIKTERIRCTSVSGYKLEAGAHFEVELRREIQQARVFIGILSEISLASSYVLFELGARWGSFQNYGGYGGAKNKIFPILAAGATGSILRDPLKQYNALNCENAGDLHQLITEIGQEISKSPGNAAAYQDKILNLMRISRQLKGQRTKAANAKRAKTAEPAKRAGKTATSPKKTGRKSLGKATSKAGIRRAKKKL
jgi:hypothetical protein